MRVAFILIAVCCWAQSPVAVRGNGEPSPVTKKKPPATPKELAGELLNSAFETTGSASAGAQPYLLWRIADGLTVIDHKKALDALNQAFADSAILGDASATLQSWVALSTAELDLPRAIEMLRTISVPYGSYDPRGKAITQVVGQLIAKNRIDAAIDLVNLLGSNGPYPYGAVGSILAALSNEDDPRRLLAFGAALTGYQAHPDRDFGTLLADNWEKLPRPVVIRALDVIVETVSGYKDEDSQMSTTYIGAKGTATFDTDRDLQLFDILLPLQACEPAKLKDLFEKYPQLKGAADLFPNGFDWKEIRGMKMTGKRTSTATAAPNPGTDFTASVRQVNQAVDTAAKDLPAGIALGQHIDSPVYRGDALRQIASARADSDSSTAHDLLTKAIAALASAVDRSSLDRAGQYMGLAFDAARKLKDEDLANEALGHELDMATLLYKVDADSDDPNLAPMDAWPSIQHYREAMRHAVALDGMKAPALLQTIRNTDVFLFCQVALAAALLDRRQEFMTSVRHGSKK